jgi:8-oxo-dGTP diphosphatase
VAVLHTRVAAYALCRDQDRILLAHYRGPKGEQRWTLPGGKVEHGEDPFDAVVRELAEETGYAVRVDRLLGIESRTHDVDWPWPRGGVLHRMCAYYEATVVGGELRYEVGGSTDRAAWVALDQVGDLERSVSIDVVLDLAANRPPTGHPPAIPVTGMLRH